MWSCERECKEIAEKIHQFKKCPLVTLLNLAESIVVIVFCITLILNPSEHHIHAHVIISGLELILEPFWEYLALAEIKLVSRK